MEHPMLEAPEVWSPLALRPAEPITRCVEKFVAPIETNSLQSRQGRL